MKKNTEGYSAGRPIRCRAHVRCVGHGVAVTMMALMASGCAVLGGSYPVHMEPAKQQFVMGNALAAVEQVGDAYGLCDMFERGTMLHAAGEYGKSRAELFAAEAVIDEFDDRAVLSGRDAVASVATLAVNEKAAPYEGEGFERVMLHTYLAFNHLMTGDLTGARVEVRKTYERQKEEAARHARALEESEKEASDKSFDVTEALDSAEGMLASTDAAASRVKNAYQNAFAYYMSAVVYELNGEMNDAYIDCKKAIELRPDAECVQVDLVRLAEKLNFSDELETWKGRFGVREIPEVGSGSVIVVIEQGMAPVKREINIPVPTKFGVISTALPVYQLSSRVSRMADLALDGEGHACAHVMADIEGMAARNLRDRMPVLMIKQVVRATGKGALMKDMENNMSYGALLGSLASFVTEQADLRGWTTLPREIQVARVWAEPGRHQLRLDMDGGAGKQVEVPVEPGKITVVSARSVGGHVYASVSDPLG